jgi:hypothetical protein
LFLITPLRLHDTNGVGKTSLAHVLRCRTPHIAVPISVAQAVMGFLIFSVISSDAIPSDAWTVAGGSICSIGGSSARPKILIEIPHFPPPFAGRLPRQEVHSKVFLGRLQLSATVPVWRRYLNLAEGNAASFPCEVITRRSSGCGQPPYNHVTRPINLP